MEAPVEVTAEAMQYKVVAPNDEGIRLGWIQTHTGHFSPLNPRVEDVRVRDIAHALSMICRYGGHTERFYSVAEHSILVARGAMSLCAGDGDLKRRVGLQGLLHDAAEAYIGDIVTPLKARMRFDMGGEVAVMANMLVRGAQVAKVQNIEDAILAAIGAALGVQGLGAEQNTEAGGLGTAVYEVDKRICIDECKVLFPQGTWKDWVLERGVAMGDKIRNAQGEGIVCMHPAGAKRAWIELYKKLGGRAITEWD